MVSRIIKNFSGPGKKHMDSEWDLTTFDENSPLTESKISGCLKDKHTIRLSEKVYKIPVNLSSEFVVVKKISVSNNFKEKLADLPEIKILKKIEQHSNIVKLIGYMSSKDKKSTLLIYEYLENGSWLDRLLHRTPTSPQPIGPVLEWPNRLKIAVGVAEALSYMHHKCSPAVVHREVKSSNVLIDGAFNAKIARFSSASFLAKDSKLAGTSSGPRHYSPEYVHTTNNEYEADDVYNFGVILLELVTGKKASCEIEHPSLEEWARKQQASKSGPIAADVFDKDVNKKYSSEMGHVFDIAVSCINTLPSKRPSMEDVSRWLLLKCSPAPAVRVGIMENGGSGSRSRGADN